MPDRDKPPPSSRSYEEVRIMELRYAKAKKQKIAASEVSLSLSEVLAARAEARLLYGLVEAAEMLNSVLTDEMEGAEGDISDLVKRSAADLNSAIDKFWEMWDAGVSKPAEPKSPGAGS